MAHSSRPRDRSGFEIAVICAVELESNAVEASFDEVWEGLDGFGKAPGDLNTYTTGRIGSYNVVLAYMPGMGKIESASVTAGSLQSFPNIKLGLVVGVCGAVPLPRNRDEIILGDVIISTGVEQFDFGRKFPTGIKTKDTLDEKLGRSTREIRAFLKKLRGLWGGKKLKEDTLKYLNELCENEDFESHRYPGTEADTLFPPWYLHRHTSGTCDCMEEDGAICERAKNSSCSDLQCNEQTLIERRRLPKSRSGQAFSSPLLKIHFGPIASGDQIMRDATFRDEFAEQTGVIAYEMEGAGAWDIFPTVVIKGVSDYADSHKNKRWQPYAAAVAASCMKAFLSQWVSSSFRAVETTPMPTPEPEPTPNSEGRWGVPLTNFRWEPLLKPPPKVKPEYEPTPERELEFESDSDEEVWLEAPILSAAQTTWLSRAWYAWRLIDTKPILVTTLIIAMLAFALGLGSVGNNRFNLSSPPIPPEINSNYPIFAIIGRTGVGKSSFIKALGGRNESNFAPEVCHGLGTCTNDVILYKTTIDDSPIYLMDTPGFDDARMSDKEVMEMIYNKLEDLYRGDKLVKGMIYLHDITQPRVGGLDARQFRAFEQLLGVDRFKNLVFVTTRWIERPSEVESQRELEREAELSIKYWKKMIDRGSQVMRHDGSANSAKLIIMSLNYKPKIQLSMSPEEVQQTLSALYNEPPVETEEPEKDNGDPDTGNVVKVQQIWIIHKVLWTMTRVGVVGIIALLAGLYIMEKKWLIFSFTWETFFGNLLIIAALAGFAGLVYRWRLLSAGIFLLHIGTIFISLGMSEDRSKGRETPPPILVFLVIFILWGFPMTYLYWLYWPHTSDMYFF